MPEVVNAEMVAAWDGAEGDSWVAREEHQDLALVAHTEHLLAAADVGRAEHVLDVGCGCGQITRECARLAADGDALGVDLSTAMLERAQQRADEEGFTNVTFARGDAQVHSFAPERFDLVVSRFGVMFFADPVAAFANIARGVKPGGRLAFIVWQELARNEWLTATRTALMVGGERPAPPTGVPGPFGLADPGRARRVLEAAGFTQVSLDDVAAPFLFGSDTDDAFDFATGIGLVRGLLEDLDDDQRARALDELRTVMAAHATDEGVVFDSKTWVISAVR